MCTSRPTVVERRIDDVSLARRFLELGLDGFVLKSHYGSTAERAGVVRAAVPGIRALGAISLNRATGGINVLAMEIAAREGARTVWMPTVDAVNEATEREAPPGATRRHGRKLQRELRAQGIEIEPVPVLAPDGSVLPETRAVLQMIARHGMVLATGRLEMKAQSYLQSYYAERAGQRANHARRSSRNAAIRQTEAFQRVTPQVVSAL